MFGCISDNCKVVYFVLKFDGLFELSLPEDDDDVKPGKRAKPFDPKG